MELLRTFLNLCQNLLVPEESRIQRLLFLEPSKLQELLPRSVVHSKDILVLFDYSNKIVRLIVKSIKYKNNLNLKKIIAKYLYEEIIDLSSDIALFEGVPPILVPMPMSRKEKKKTPLKTSR